MVTKGEGDGGMGKIINKTRMDINFLDHDIGILKGQGFFGVLHIPL